MRDDDFETSRRTRFLHGVNRLFARAYHHAEVEGLVRAPPRGPAVIVSNHISSLDPLLIQAVVHRPIVWMVAAEYFEIGPLGWLFKSIRSIPVSRNGRDSTALRAAMRALAAGRVLGVFPEGRIAKGRNMLPLQTGAAMIAMRSHATIIPVHQHGTTRGQSMFGALLVPQRVRLRFGEPIQVSRKEAKSSTPEELTSRLETVMRNLEASHRARAS
jgi:1-acyl-sn-glycerol-3-phosphate acyltransferase